MGRHERAARFRVFCLPSIDQAFANVVARVISTRLIESPRELEYALASHYPNARVRRRELSGEPIETWYVYREDSFPAHPDDPGDS